MAESSVPISSPMDNPTDSNSWFYNTTASKIAQVSRRGEAKLRQLVLLNNAYLDFSSSATVWQREAENTWFQEVFDDALEENESEDGYVSLSLSGEQEYIQPAEFLYPDDTPAHVIDDAHATDNSDEFSESFSTPVSICSITSPTPSMSASSLSSSSRISLETLPNEIPSLDLLDKPQETELLEDYVPPPWFFSPYSSAHRNFMNLPEGLNKITFSNMKQFYSSTDPSPSNVDLFKSTTVTPNNQLVPVSSSRDSQTANSRCLAWMCSIQKDLDTVDFGPRPGRTARRKSTTCRDDLFLWPHFREASRKGSPAHCRRNVESLTLAQD